MATVSEVWGDEAGSWRTGGKLHWTELAQVQRRINRRVSGDPDVDPYLHVIKRYFSLPLDLDRVLTLGCGFGEIERGLVQYGTIGRHDAFDVAPGAIAKAHSEAAAQALNHVHYEIADLNRAVLERNAYDWVLGVHSVHHISCLEHLFAEVRAALKPGGLFALNEFVGPSQFQWTDRQLEVVNGLFAVLPASLRRNRAHSGTPKPHVTRPTIAEMNRIDPSEAIRSAEILALLPRYFEILEVRGWGGTVLHLLLHEIAGNFEEVTGGPAILDAVCEVEEALIAAGDLTDDFALIVCRAR